MEYNFGSLDHRQLCLRFSAPWYFDTWRSMLRLRYWRVAIRDWEVWFDRFPFPHRCYCSDGYSMDGSICICGFILNVWYSFYNGEVPCCCDRALAEWEAENEAEPTHA